MMEVDGRRKKTCWEDVKSFNFTKEYERVTKGREQKSGLQLDLGLSGKLLLKVYICLYRTFGRFYLIVLELLE